jgi:symplekin
VLFCLLNVLLQTISETDKEEMPPPEESAQVTSAAGDIAPVLVSSSVLTPLKTPKEENSNSSAVPFNSSAVPLDIETVEAKVPSADAAELSIEIQESSETSHASTEPQGTQEHSGSFVSSLPADNSSVGVSLAQCSETRSPSSSTIEGSQSQFSSMSALTSQHVLPKLVVTNVDLTDEAKDLLQKEAFLRILARDKQEESGGSKARLPLLSHLSVEVLITIPSVKYHSLA